jgi:gluconate kinase
VRFFYLKIGYEVVAKRLELRTDHFFDKKLLDSQFAILEEPQPNEAFIVDQNRALAEVAQAGPTAGPSAGALPSS